MYIYYFIRKIIIFFKENIMSTRRSAVNKDKLLKSYIQNGGLVSDNYYNTPQTQNLGVYSDEKGDLYEIGLKPEHYQDNHEINEFLELFGQIPSYPSRGILDPPNYINIYSREILLLQHFLKLLESELGPERLKMEVEKVIGACNKTCNCSTEQSKLNNLKNNILNFIKNSGEDYKNDLINFLNNQYYNAQQQRQSTFSASTAKIDDSDTLKLFLSEFIKILDLEKQVKSLNTQQRLSGLSGPLNLPTPQGPPPDPPQQQQQQQQTQQQQLLEEIRKQRKPSTSQQQGTPQQPLTGVSEITPMNLDNPLSQSYF